MKRLLLSALLLLITKAAVGGIFFGLLYAGAESSAVFRPEGQEAHGVAMLGYVAWSLAFMLLFSRGPERRGWREGLRFGIIVWFFYFVPMILGIYGYFAVDKAWAGAALAGGTCGGARMRSRCFYCVPQTGAISACRLKLTQTAQRDTTGDIGSCNCPGPTNSFVNLSDLRVSSGPISDYQRRRPKE